MSGARKASVALLAVVAAAGACHAQRADPTPPRELAIAEATRGNPVSALRMLQRVVAREPADSEAYAHIADLYRRYGWVDEGRTFFAEHASRPASTAPELGYVAAAFAAFTGRADESRQRIAGARRRRPPSAAEALAMAEALAAIGDEETARALLGEAVRNHPEQYEPRVRFAQALANASDSTAARHEIMLALARFPDQARVVGAAASMHFLFGDLAQSEAFTRRWLQLAPGSAEARWNMTRIALHRGDYKAADSLLFLTAQTRR